MTLSAPELAPSTALDHNSMFQDIAGPGGALQLHINNMHNTYSNSEWIQFQCREALETLNASWLRGYQTTSVAKRILPLGQLTGPVSTAYGLVAISVIGRMDPTALEAPDIQTFLRAFVQSMTDEAEVAAGRWLQVLEPMLPEKFTSMVRRHVRNNMYYRRHGMPDYLLFDDASAFLEQMAAPVAPPPLATGLPSLDRRLGGPLKFSMLGGAPGVGKTDLALQIAVHQLRQDSQAAVFLIELDMSRETVLKRICSQICQRPIPEWLDRHRRGVFESQDAEAAAEFKRLCKRLYIADSRDTAIDIMPLQSRAHAFFQACNAGSVLFIVDYVQKVQLARRDGEPPCMDQLQVDRTRLDMLTECFGPSVGADLLVISEVRKSEGSRERTADDLSGSGRAAYAADNVILLDRVDRVPGEGLGTNIVANVAKSRDGHQGRFELNFDYERHTFRELTTNRSLPSKSTPTSRKKRGAASEGLFS